MTNNYHSLTVNGTTYEKEDLVNLINTSTNSPPWQQAFFQFLQEWLDEKEWIAVSTSGSTGTPKRIRLAKEKMVNSAKMTGNYFGFHQGQKALLCLPCHYIAGKMMVVRALVWGWDLQVVEPRGNPMETIQHPIDFAAMIPLQAASIMKQTPSSMKWIKQLIIGGGKVNYSLLQQLQQIPTACFATYGMTETITHIAIQPLNGKAQTTAFQVLPMVQIELDKRGCLVITAPQVVDDKIVTNDLVQLVGTQHFIWLGRYDNVINTGSVKVFPEQIEKKLEPILKERFFISSLPDKKLGQKVVLIIESPPFTSTQLDDFQERTQYILSKFERPRQLFFLPQFVETTTGKVQRSRTKDLL